MATKLDFTFDVKPDDRWVTIRFFGNNDYDSEADAWIGPPLSTRGIEEIATRLRQEQPRCVQVSCEPQSLGPGL